MIIFENEFFSLQHKISFTPLNETFEPHIHEEWEFFYLVEGDVYFVIDGIKYNLKKNSLIFIKPATIHNIIINSNAIYERYVIHLDENAFSKTIIDLFKEVPLINENDDFIPSFNNLLLNLNSLDEESKNIAIKDLLELYAIKNKITINYEDNTNKNYKSTFANIIDFIDENIESKIDVNLIKEKFFVSSSWISHVFKENTGLSFINYVNTKKIVHAQTLLNKGLSPLEVSNICSYEYYSTFYRQYKQYYQMPPRKSNNVKPSSNLII